MKYPLLLIAILSMAVLACSKQETQQQTAVAAEAPKGEWQPLFAADLSNAEYNDTVWSMEEGVFFASYDQAIWTTREYDNFVLSLEFKNAPGTNSGVIVYCNDKADWIPNSVEVQIADDYAEKWANSPKDWQCGAIFGHLPAKKQKVVREPGQWNHMIVTCVDQSIKVELNDLIITDMNMARWTSATTNPDGSPIPEWLSTPFAELPTKGYIGFQGKHGDASIWFRNVRIKEL
jgi:hypothetical protein